MTISVELLDAALNGVIRKVQPSLVVIESRQSHTRAGHSLGAGVIWSESGLVVTNHHVVNGHIPHLLLFDGREIPARLLTRDPQVDLALLQIEAEKLIPIPLATAGPLRVGELVFAIGHPWGLRGYVTGGLISSLGSVTTGDGSRRIDIIRSDARLAPGNSGGPLVNMAGEMVGINAMIVGGDLGVAIAWQVVNDFVNKSLKSQSKTTQAGAGAQV